MGMVGGGRGAFIGGLHRIAANMDGQIELVCGAFSSDPQRSRVSGADFFLPPSRCYGTFEEMMNAEAALPLGERMDFVSIVTPNHLHFPAAKCALEHGFPVLSDKPATFNLVEYPQGWLATRLEQSGQKQAAWRTDPKRSGVAGCIGDIGTHAENLAEYVTGLKIRELAADLTSFVEGRALDDDGNVLLRFDNGAKGILHASQIAVGEENNLSLRVYGELGGIEWHQKEPNTLLVKSIDRPVEVWRTGMSHLGAHAAANTRTPAGHPEGYLEAFANIYRNFAHHLRALIDGTPHDPTSLDYPNIKDGIRGMAFIEAVVESSRHNARWTNLEDL